jgi:argininosuccinate lyase
MRRTTKTIWGDGAPIDPEIAAYTAGDDRAWDARLLRWDILGTLGHVEGLRASGLLTAREHARLERALRVALRDADAGRFTLGPDDEDCHTTLERRLIERLGTLGEKVHTGRSRNDQVLAAIRLLTKDSLFRVEARTLDAADALVRFARAHRDVLLPGYTHQRRAMPSTVALWASGFAAGLLDGLLPLEAALALVDRSPLGSAAGFGVPVPLDRARTARALGFAEAHEPVTAVQPSRGRVEAIVLAALWGIAHELGKLSWDVILFSSEEFGYLRLPENLATGSSIMPHKRNPDLFELTRAREGAVAGFLAQAVAIAGKLPSGYHRDLQLLKAPLFLGLDAVEAMAARIAAAVPLLAVDRERARAAVSGVVLATDAAYALVLRGTSFRGAYREIAARVRRGEAIPGSPTSRILASRRDAGYGTLSRTIAARRRALALRRRRHDGALARLAGGRGR